MNVPVSGPTKPRLGRGLDALLPTPALSDRSSGEPLKVPVEELHANRKQPRTRFDEDTLEELADSVKELGILEPILVRRRNAGGYEIIAGERRWRAAQRAGFKEVPVLIREFSDQRAFEAALVENLQREDLNPMESARAFQRLIEEHGHNHDSVARLVGKDRSTVANATRLLKLPLEAQQMIESGKLSEGHGRAILGAPDPGTMKRLALLASSRGLSVRETERRARQAVRSRPGEPGDGRPSKSANVRDLEQRISRALGMKATIEDHSGRGYVAVHYSSYDELDGLLDRVLR